MAEPSPVSSAALEGDRSLWNWLLLVPIVVPLSTFLFNADGPRLAGIPRFYWFQLGLVVLSVAVTALVYRLTKRAR